jgi:ABC-type branched-subunit amino acid transport system substrate-binding protein
MMMVRSFDRRWLAAFVGLACVTTAFALMSGPSRAATKSCKGTPAVFLLDTNLSNNIGGSQISKDLAYGYRAATAAINKTCQLGRPIKFIACDDKVSPNGAADCGRRAVAAKAFGVSSYTGFGENFTAPVVAAKIPLLPFSGNSATESTSPLSYPFGDSLPIALSSLPAAKALGAKKLAYLHLDLPAIGFLLNLIRKAASHFGIQIVADVPVPPTASDMTSLTAQALAAGPQALTTIVAPSQLTAIFKQVVAQGKNPAKFPLISYGNVMTSGTIASLPKNVTNGMIIGSWGINPASPSDRNTPVVKQYLRELKAAKQPTGQRDATASGLLAWGELHAIADALKAKHLAPTAANVPRALLTSKLPAIMHKYGGVPRDFRKNPFASDPVLKNFRIGSDKVIYYRLNAKQQPIRLVSTSGVTIQKTPTFIKKSIK